MSFLRSVAFTTVATLFAIAMPSQAAIVVVDIDDGVSGNTVNTTTAGPGNQTDWVGAGNDGTWNDRTDADFTGGDIWQNLNTSAPPVIVTTIAVSNGYYDVYLNYGAEVTGASNVFGASASLDNSSFVLFNNSTGTKLADGSSFDVRQGLIGNVLVTDGTLEVYNRAWQPAGHTGGNRSYPDAVGYEFTQAAPTAPEPASALLLGFGVMSLGFTRRRRR